jgi:thiamine pyrophosphate-dependent acetolactate synthase large subunit-like protein
MSSEDPSDEAGEADRADEGNGVDDPIGNGGEADEGADIPRRADQIACTERVLGTTPEAAIVANLGVASYALAGIEDRPRNFYCWGAMGLATSIGLGVALAIDDPVTVLEGDGSMCMSLGALSTVAACDPPNLAIVVWENGVYGTTGGQPVATVDIAGAARACGLAATTAETGAEFETGYAEAVAHEGAALVVCRVPPIDPDARPPLDSAHVARRFRDALTDGTEGAEGTVRGEWRDGGDR